MSRKYTTELFNKISEKQYISNERDLDILVKPIPDEDRPGAADPRLIQTTMKMMENAKEGDAGLDMTDVETIRKMFGGVKSTPIVEDVLEKRIDVSADNIKIPVRIYQPKNLGDELVPVFYYIHGGGFIAGRPEVVEEMCKLVVERTGCVSVSVDYRLAPENQFPVGLDDCYNVLKWIYENAKDFGGDKEKICISGDSAGGNLATVCALKDKEENTNMVKVQALIYPTVNMAGVEDEDFKFSLDEYEILDEHSMFIIPSINSMKDSASGSLSHSIGAGDGKNPLASPYLADLSNMPPTIILYGEHDYLRVENESYARKLKKAGIDVKAVRYRGLGHGFADIVGGCPQAEDCMNEISDFMMSYFK